MASLQEVIDRRSGDAVTAKTGWTAVEGGASRGGETGGTIVCGSGFRSLDRLLPAGGVRRGSLLEFLGSEASGASALACAIACRLLTFQSAAPAHPGGGTIIVVDRRGRFHPPAVIPWLDPQPDRHGSRNSGASRSSGGCGPLVVARPSRDEDEIWAIDQALRCPGVTAVLAWPGRVSTTALRRWQLAARSSGAVGLLVRPERARREPSWAEVRLSVAAAASPAGLQEIAGLGIRRLHLVPAGGPWSGEQPEERGVEIAIDMGSGREAVAVGQSAEGVRASPREVFPPAGMSPRLVAVCRDAGGHELGGQVGPQADRPSGGVPCHAS